MQEKEVKIPKVAVGKNIKASSEKKNSEDILRIHCNSIPLLSAPIELERSNNTVFDRLSKPTLKKFKSSRAPIFPPIIYYDDCKKPPQSNYASARVTNGFIDTRVVYSRNAGYHHMTPKLFQFNFERNNDG